MNEYKPKECVFNIEIFSWMEKYKATKKKWNYWISEIGKDLAVGDQL